MKTSYYGNKKLNLDEMNLVSISCSEPGRLKRDKRLSKCWDLVPDWDLVSRYKKGMVDEKQYVREYYSKKLKELDPRELYERLGEDAVLLCWEGVGSFCHRRVVARWLEKSLGVVVDEL